MRCLTAASAACLVAGLGCNASAPSEEDPLIPVRGAWAMEVSAALNDALGSEYGSITVNDQTPRIDLPEGLRSNEQVVYLKGVSVRVLTNDLTGVTLVREPKYTELSLAYGDAEVIIKDMSTKEGNNTLREELLASSKEAMLAINVDVPKAHRDAWSRELSDKDIRFTERYKELHQLVRKALWQQGLPAMTRDEPNATYDSARLLFLKAELAKRLHGDADNSSQRIRAAASGPVMGLIASENGRDKKALWVGPDSMLVELRVRGTPPPTHGQP